MSVTVQTPAQAPQLTPGASRALLTILTAAREDARPVQGPGVDVPTTTEEPHERTAA